jgi:hypothetical protein
MRMKAVSVILLMSFLLSLCATILVHHQVEETTSIIALDVCSPLATAGSKASPSVPEPIFAFFTVQQQDMLSNEDSLSLPLIYIPSLFRPPAV